MTQKTKAGGLSLKSIFFSIRDALAYRSATRDPGNRDIAINRTNDAPSSVDSALQLSTVWACVRLISGAISTLPLFLYERTQVAGRDSRKLALDHPLYFLLHDSPNADMTTVEFVELIATRLLTWGNFYGLKTYGAQGQLIAIDPLDPALMDVRRAADGSKIFKYQGVDTPYTEREVWHVKGFGTDSLVGISPIGVGWRSLLGAAAAERAASELYTNNMRPAAVVSVKEFLTPDQRAAMKTKVMGAVFGNNQTGQLQLLEGGAEYRQLSMNPVDAQMVEHLNRGVEDICRWYQVPPSMIGHGTAVSNWGTGREQINLGFLQYVLDPILKRIEASANKYLLSPAERRKYYVEFSREGLLRADTAGRAAFYSVMTQNGIYTRNFCRALENQEPLPGGDELTVQSNLIPLTLLGEITTSAPTPPGN